MATGPIYWLYTEIQRSLDLKVSRKKLKEEYGALRNTSLLQIQEQLAEWNIKSMGVALKPEQLDKIPLPAITHMKEEYPEFFILKNINGNSVKYARYQHGEMTQSITDFLTKWSGSALLMEATQKSGDPQFEAERKLERRNRVREIMITTLVVSVLVQVGFVWPGLILPILLQVVGLSACIVLFLKGLGVDTFISQTTCRQGTKTDCDKIINSRLGRLLGPIQIAELGILFFGVNLLAQLFSLLSRDALNDSVGYLCLVAVPVTVILIFYQGFVLRSWCLLCVTVAVIVWMLCLGLSADRLIGGPDFQDVAYILSACSICVLLWLLIRPQLISASQSRQRHAAITKFRRDRDLFDAMLSREKTVDPEITSGDVVLGNKDAAVTITMVTSPSCAPCAAAHQVLDELYNTYGGKLRLVYRFAVSGKENGSLSNRVSRELINLGVLNNKSLHEAIQAWYSPARPAVDDWVKVHAHPLHDQTEHALKRHESWCSKNGIRTTPSIFVQGMRVPAIYSLDDVVYFLKLRLVNS